MSPIDNRGPAAPTLRRRTKAVHAGHDPQSHHGFVNPPLYRGSTILFPTMAALEEALGNKYAHEVIAYARYGTPTSRAFEQAMADLEGGHAGVVTSSGLSAITVTLMAFAAAGDHILVPDSVYQPARLFCTETLARFGVETTFYDPLAGSDIDALVRPGTRLIYLESPGSLTLEIQDIPAIVGVARRHGIVTVIDNTWASPMFCQPLQLGVDVVVHAATKYILGHADAMLGVIVAGAGTFDVVKRSAIRVGQCAGPDDVYLGLRGLRTLAGRMEQHQQHALELARWLQQRAEVGRVIHPALPDDPGHEIWKRDFSGSSGLFSFVLRPVPKSAVAAMLDGMTLFAMGASWGGFESLLIPVYPDQSRITTPGRQAGPMLRMHAGLEHVDDLIADLTAGFARLNAAARNRT